MKGYLFNLFFLLMVSPISFAQKIATFEVEIKKPTNDIYIPLSINLDELTFVHDSVLTLWQVEGNENKPILFQIKQGNYRSLHWILNPKDNTKSSKYTYLLQRGKPDNTYAIKAKNGNGFITIQAGIQNLLRYQYQTLYPPAGVDTSYKRGAFIHPLWSPHGQELTRVQPKDHYHHYGIWNPWTRVLFEKDTVDFWNIGDKKGTVRFANFLSQNNGAVFSEFEALHQHIAFKKMEGEKVALNEVQTIRVYQPNNDYYIVDITSTLSCASNSPVVLLTYRYGGFGWRTTEKWDNKNSEILTSEGKNRRESDGAKSRWCIVQGALGESDYGGAVMLSYPANYNHPEPLRIWPENQYDRGDMFANFSPTKDKDWLLEVGKTYTLKYRLWVFNGKFTKEKAESAWQYFAQPPSVKINSSK